MIQALARRGRLARRGFAVVLGLSSVAFAQEASPPAPPPPAPGPAAPTQAPPNSVPAQPLPPPNAAADPPPPVIDLRSEPPPPPVPRTGRLHDGFYARLNLGFGTLGATVDTTGGGENPNADGDTLALDVAVGFSPRPGIAVGGTLMLESLPSADFGGASPTEATVGTMLLGPFFDGYPNARGGFHLGGALGLSQDRLSTSAVGGFKKANGFGLAGWVGYDLWVAEQWSVGGLVRLMGTRASADVDGSSAFDTGTAHIATQSVHVVLTTVYH